MPASLLPGSRPDQAFSGLPAGLSPSSGLLYFLDVVQDADDDGPPARRALRAAFVDERDGPLPAMLLALTVLAGVVDATSILALDHVFVAAMTGNLVILGLGLSGATGFSVSSSAPGAGRLPRRCAVGARHLPPGR